MTATENKRKQSRIAKLNNGKLKGLGLAESLALKSAGRTDGKRGLPRQDEAEHWVCPHLDRELRAYDEFTARFWGDLQLEQEARYQQVGQLVETIQQLQAKVSTAQQGLGQVAAPAPNTVRHQGEHALTDDQLQQRRNDEQARQLAPRKAQLSQMQATLADTIDQLVALRHAILQDNNTSKLISARVRNHLLQRMDVYWGAVLVKHPAAKQMPAVPCVEAPIDHAEVSYMQLHQDLLRKAEQLCQTANNNEV